MMPRCSTINIVYTVILSLSIPPLILWLWNKHMLQVDSVCSLVKEEDAYNYIRDYNIQRDLLCNENMRRLWNRKTNHTAKDQGTEIPIFQAEKLYQGKKHYSHEYIHHSSGSEEHPPEYDWQCYHDPLVQRQLKIMSRKGIAVLPKKNLAEFQNLTSEMAEIVNQAKYCDFDPSTRNASHQCSLTEAKINKKIMTSTNIEELLYLWQEYHRPLKEIRPLFEQSIKFLNLAAQLNGFPDWGEYWLDAYEDEEIMDIVKILWEEIRPLHEQMHAYIRRKLIQKFPSVQELRADGPIPAHLVGGSLKGKYVGDVDPYFMPFPNYSSPKLTEALQKKGLSTLQLFKMAESFFVSLGMKPMTKEFWKNSIFERPSDRDIHCEGSAWDFCDGKDYRILLCAEVDYGSLLTIHHEMGHIQYFMEYSDLPHALRHPINYAFHEAIGEAIILSLMSPKYLKKLGLISEAEQNYETELNTIFSMAVYQIMNLPLTLHIDFWRWKIFSGEMTLQEINTKWWENRLEYEGYTPPVPRSEDDFDAGTNFHVYQHIEALRYFLARVIHFQIHEGLCAASGHKGPLYNCDISGSKAAGDLLSSALKLGSSRPWPEVLDILTGGKTFKIDARPLLDYFQPLHDWLKEKNKDEYIGWR